LKCVTRPRDEKTPHQQIEEVRSGGSYISQNDLRVHFGLGKAEKVDLLEIRWPSGQLDTLRDMKANQLIIVKEGAGIIQTMQFTRTSQPRTVK
jgi:enediyne biosynthesis protein E4